MSSDSVSLVDDVRDNGFAVLHDVVSMPALAALLDDLQSLATVNARDLFSKSPVVQSLAHSNPSMTIARKILGAAARPVKATLFDKTSAQNWKVPAHQDVTIMVKEQIETSGFGPWTTKAGQVHVQPPHEILENMVSLRFHLDDCDETNGALKVWPGSHRLGRLRDAGVHAWIADQDPVPCPVPARGVMVMRPLIIHASSASDAPRHRRVVHIDYAADDLPNGLQWAS